MSLFVQLALKIAASVAMGLLIGMEREWAHKDAGVRTFAITALLGTISWLVAPVLAFVQFSMVVLIVFLVNVYACWKGRGLQITTSVSLAATNALGIAIGTGNFFLAFACAVAITALLSWKTELITLSGKLTEEEIRGALLLAFISGVAYPLLPAQPVDPWKILNLRSVWLTIILVSGLKFINYILLRIFGTRGIRYSALLGGLVNSAAMSLFLGEELKADESLERDAPGNMLLAGSAMILRNWVLVVLFALPLGVQHSLPTVIVLAPMMLIAGAMAGLAILRTRRAQPHAQAGDAQGTAEKQPEQRPGQADQRKGQKQLLKSPLALRAVLGFGLLFLVLTMISGGARVLFGTLGFLIVIVVGALASAASSAILLGQELAGGSVGGIAGAIAMFLATVVGLLENVVIFWIVARKPTTSLRIVLLILAPIVIGVMMIFLVHVLGLK